MYAPPQKKTAEENDDLLTNLQKDKEFYEGQDMKIRQRIDAKVKQLEDAQKEGLKCMTLISVIIYRQEAIGRDLPEQDEAN